MPKESLSQLEGTIAQNKNEIPISQFNLTTQKIVNRIHPPNTNSFLPLAGNINVWHNKAVQEAEIIHLTLSSVVRTILH